ncbi:MAG: hypothetical protein ACPL5F_09930 [Moorellaceae bacterium]
MASLAYQPTGKFASCEDAHDKVKKWIMQSLAIGFEVAEVEVDFLML